MAKLGLKTGASAFDYSNDSSNKIDFFKGNVKYTFLKKGVDVSGIILPAFDPTYSDNDPARATSVGSYRQDVITADQAHGDFTLWLAAIQVYSYYGKAYNMIISPKIAGMKDPISMLRDHIFFRCKDDAELQKLIKRPENSSMNDKLPLPNTSTMGFMNVWSNPSYVPEGSNDTGEANRVLILSYTASMKLYEDLNKPRPATMDVLDPKNPNYLFGDITNPATALRFHTSTMKMQNKREAFCLSLGREGRGGVYTVEHATITPEMLAGRVDFDDTDVLNIPSYEQLVDLLVEEGTVPYDLIAQVCSDNYVGSFPKKSVGTTTYNAPAASNAPVKNTPAPQNQYAPASSLNYDEEEDDIDYSPSPAPAQPAYQPAATAPQPVAATAAPAEPASTGLTPEETAELEALTARFSNPANNLTLDEIRRYQALRTKAIK